MSERVEPLDLGIEWEPNAPEAVLVSDDNGAAVLALCAHLSDEDQRCVVFEWHGARSATMGDPNDEAISGHRLYSVGLATVLWAGVVKNSRLIAELEAQNSVHPAHDPRRFAGLTHYVLRLKECVVEVVAVGVTTRRTESSTRRAALT